MVIFISTNEKFVKKYFFFDIDGTLSTGFPEPYVPESTKRALKKLEEKGHFLSIATGRSHAKAIALLDELGFKNMVSDGGNGITIDKKLLGIKPLNKENCVALLEELEEKGIPWGISMENSPIRYTKDNSFVEYTNDVYMKNIVDPNLDFHKIDTFYKLYVACKPEIDDTLEGLKNLPFVRFHDAYLFVEPDDKSVGIKAVMDHFKAPYKDVVVFGDQKNDLKMFRDEWTSIAMGNAIDDLKEKADFVTKAADDDGIEFACEHFGWI